jgi:hypothetical protein
MGRNGKRHKKNRTWGGQFTKSVKEGDSGSRPKSHKIEPEITSQSAVHQIKKREPNPFKRLFGTHTK